MGEARALVPGDDFDVRVKLDTCLNNIVELVGEVCKKINFGGVLTFFNNHAYS